MFGRMACASHTEGRLMGINGELTVIIPFYNESNRIAPTLDSLQIFCKENQHVVREVICVDDGSTDSGKTAERVMSFSGKLPLRLLRLSVNSGKWAAIHEGMKNVRTDAVLLLDADGSVSIDELKRMDFLEKALKHKCAVFGSRFANGAEVEGKSLVRSFVSQGYRWYARILYWYAKGDHDVDDPQCPFKLFFMSRVRMPLVSNRFAGDIELALMFEGPIWTHPVFFLHHSGSTVKVGTAWQMATETFRIARNYRKQRRGLQEVIGV